MRSKQNHILELFFNSSRQWHFEELLREAGISRPQLVKWLKHLRKKGIIKRIKKKCKMPYYVQDSQSPSFISLKKLYGYQKIAESGLLEHIITLKDIKVAVLFGSFSRSDWYKDSDIDIFIYGNDRDLNTGKYEVKLKRDIQIHKAGTKEDLKKMDKLLPYIFSGEFVKGSLQDMGIEIHAKT